MRFYINNQVPKQLQIPYDKPLEEGRFQNARQILDSLEIKDNKLIQQTLSENGLVDALFKFNYDLKADKNPAGLLLKVLGLR